MINANAANKTNRDASLLGCATASDNKSSPLSMYAMAASLPSSWTALLTEGASALGFDVVWTTSNIVEGTCSFACDNGIYTTGWICFKFSHLRSCTTPTTVPTGAAGSLLKRKVLPRGS